MNYSTASQELEPVEFEELVSDARRTSEWYSAETNNDIWIHIQTTPTRNNGIWGYHALLEVNAEPERVFSTLEACEDYLSLRFEVED